MLKTKNSKFLMIPRLLAGLPLLVIGVKHFIDPGHMKSILIASEIPMVDVNVFAAPAGEVLAGVLLLIGFYPRIGGFIGAASMVVALYSTVVLSKLTVDTLPAGLLEVPFVPPLPLPLVVLVCSLVIVALGGGAWRLNSHKPLGSGDGSKPGS
jgi:uncharacterized membrane protein YphA (DoxX/SURF4 family)